MRRSQLLALLTGLWAILATSIGWVLAPVEPAAAVDVCPTLFVPAGLPDAGTAAPPGAFLDDNVKAELDALTDLYRYDGVAREVLYVPADDGRVAWVRESGYTAGDRTDWQVVVCLGGLVPPEALRRPVDEAREMVAANRLVPVTDADGSSVVTGLRPGPGEVLPFGSEVVIAAEPGGRDLSVADIDGSVVDAERIEVEVVVENTGELAAGPASLFLEYDGDPLDVIDVQVLEPGERVALSRSLPVPSQARGTTWTLVALLEYSDDDPDNNRATLAVAPGLPDLVLEDVNVRADADGVVVAGTVVNRGPGDAAATTLRVRVADATPVVLSVPTLAGGAEQPFLEKVSMDGGAGEVEVEALVDPEGQVEEVDDTNNQVTRVVLLSSSTDLTEQDGAAGPEESAGSGLPGWWWIPVIGVVLAVLAGTRAIRRARRTQDQDRVRRHLRLRTRPDPGHQSISQDPTGRGSHTVRLEPSAGDVQVWVEEVEQR